MDITGDYIRHRWVSKMKKEIYDIHEITDSKELYSERPNPFIAAFVYCLVGLLAAALIYSFFGKIDIVATAAGVVRPNDDVSTVSSMAGGRLVEVNLTDGQQVSEGDLLFKIDTSESKVSLDSLKKSAANLEKEIAAYNKFVKNAGSGKNPFSRDRSSSEYPYYIEFQNYLLSLKNGKLNAEYDRDSTAQTIRTLKSQIEEYANELEGLIAYKTSIEQGKNCCQKFPEYNIRYNLYAEAMDALEQEYQSQKRQIETSTAAESNQNYIKQYTDNLRQYGYLLDSIKKGSSCFPDSEKTICRLLYDEYLAGIAEHERSYQNAKEMYEYYLEAGSEGTDNSGSDDSLSSTGFSDYEISTAKIKMESAKAAVETYKNGKIIEYSQTVTELESKLKDLKLAADSERSKSELLTELEKSFATSKNQQYFKAIAETDSSIQTMENELRTARSNLKANELALELSRNSVDGNGEILSVSMASMETLAAVLGKIDTLRMQLDEANAQIKQVSTQIKQGTVNASIGGVLNVPNAIIKGDVIAAGTALATIIPENETAFKVQLYVSNADIGNVEVGDEVKYNLAAFPSSQYGILKGHVTSISKDVLTRDGNYSGYYLVEASIENRTLKDKDGNIGQLAVGMEAEAKIVTQEKSIIRYLLEKIDLF